MGSTEPLLATFPCMLNAGKSYSGEDPPALASCPSLLAPTA